MTIAFRLDRKAEVDLSWIYLGATEQDAAGRITRKGPYDGRAGLNELTLPAKRMSRGRHGLYELNAYAFPTGEGPRGPAVDRASSRYRVLLNDE